MLPSGLSDLHIQFEEWTKARQAASIGTNTGSQPLAFQNWRRFKEAFAPELVKRAVDETADGLGRCVRTCLDPCAGSGTTPLTCQFLGVEPIAIEVNPFLADLIEAKLCLVDEAIVARRCSEVIATGNDRRALRLYDTAPPTFVEPGKNGRYLFNAEVALRLANLLCAIQRIPEVAISRLFRVLLGSAAIGVCNATVSGKGRRYRQNWHKLGQTESQLDRAFVQAVESAVFDIARYSRRKTLSYDLRRGDARELITSIPEVDLAVFSPPYPNSFDYTDVYNIELWALGYLRSKEENRILRNATMRSHVQVKRDFGYTKPVTSVRNSIAKLRKAEGLWDKSIPDMIGAYFSDLSSLLRGIRAKMPLGGRVYLVVGDSRYAGVDIPVAEALFSMSAALGFSPINLEPFRSMRASPQQGGRPELPESLLVLAAC